MCCHDVSSPTCPLENVDLHHVGLGVRRLTGVVAGVWGHRPEHAITKCLSPWWINPSDVTDLSRPVHEEDWGSPPLLGDDGDAPPGGPVEVQVVVAPLDRLGLLGGGEGGAGEVDVAPLLHEHVPVSVDLGLQHSFITLHSTVGDLGGSQCTTLHCPMFNTFTELLKFL